MKDNVLNEIREKFLDDKCYFIEWNVYGLDAERVPQNSETIFSSTISQLNNKSKAIVLLHDGYGNINTVNSIRDIIVKANLIIFGG